MIAKGNEGRIAKVLTQTNLEIDHHPHTLAKLTKMKVLEK
jgi:hypothetical protein